MAPGEKGILRAMKPREEGLKSNNIKPIETQTPHMVSSTIVIGLGSTMLNISLVNIVIFSVERSSLGTVAGLNTVFRNLGSAWGPAVAGTIMDQFKDTLLLLTSPYIDLSTISLCISINILSRSITIHHTSYCA